jgi:transposase
VNIVLSDEDRSLLTRWLSMRTLPQRQAIRARIILELSQVSTIGEAADNLGVSPEMASRWKRRFTAEGVKGLATDAPRSGRPRSIPEDRVKAVLTITRLAKPDGATHWSTRTMAKTAGMSKASVQRIWSANGLKPHLTRSFKLSQDPDFEKKLIDVVGLYVNPPAKAMVFCVDEKSQIQALDRTQPGLPMKKGRCETMTHDYKRNGTTTLFAALEVLTGKVIGACKQAHKNADFISFLKQIDAKTPKDVELHIILDNYGTHKHANVKAWLEKHPRFHMHFVPTSCSWLNLVERFFAEITNKAIRRGCFDSVQELKETIENYLKVNNAEPKPFTWTATAESIIEKVNRCRAIYETQY